MSNLSAYDDKYKKDGYGVQYPDGHVIRIYKHFVENLLAKKDSQYKSLDYGCGNGIHSKYLAEQGFEVYGLDIIDEAINQAQINNSEYANNFRVIKNNNILEQFGDEKFDLIFANQSLYYLNDLELKSVVEQFHSILNDGGIVVFTMMSTKNYYSECIEEELSNGLSKVVLQGRLNEVTYVNFVKNYTDLKNRFSLFMPLYCGIYDMTMLEGSSEHMYYIGIKKY